MRTSARRSSHHAGKRAGGVGFDHSPATADVGLPGPEHSTALALRRLLCVPAAMPAPAAARFGGQEPLSGAAPGSAHHRANAHAFRARHAIDPIVESVPLLWVDVALEQRRQARRVVGSRSTTDLPRPSLALAFFHRRVYRRPRCVCAAGCQVPGSRQGIPDGDTGQGQPVSWCVDGDARFRELFEVMQ
jgi:hypothetical protein